MESMLKTVVVAVLMGALAEHAAARDIFGFGDLGNGEWQAHTVPKILADGSVLVFRLKAGAGSTPSPYQRFMDKSVNDDVIYHGGALPCDRHFRSGILNTWPQHLIETVRVSVYEDGQEKAWVVFDGKGSTSTNWFSKSRVLSSSWTDLKARPTNFCSLAGHLRVDRTFFINHAYGGCPRDRGWLLVKSKKDPCSWANKSGEWPIILYSKKTTFINWNTQADVGVADMLTVTLRLRKGASLENRCPK